MDSLSVDTSDEEQNICPICYGLMDETDLAMFPCSCNYQICLWCLKRVTENENQCPNCRRPYDKKNFRTIERKVEKKPVKIEEPQTISLDTSYDMEAARVIQKNLVYVIGLPIEASSESTIRRMDMFGQYGNLSKVVVNSRSPVCDKSNTCGVYLTYENNEQALDCIRAVDGFTYCHRLLKASYGTTKYCYNFIKGYKCNNPDCLFLHQKADREDCFTKDEMAERQLDFYRLTHPGHGSQWDERLQKYIYNRPSEEYLTSLPPPQPDPAVVAAKAKKTKIVQEEVREVVLPLAPVLFSLKGEREVEGKWNELLEKELERAIPYTFEKVGADLQGSVFGLKSIPMKEENVDLDKILQCGNKIENLFVEKSQMSGGFQLTEFSTGNSL